jgi:RluA family pseudouridine synthase
MEIESRILLEDDGLIVVDKPAGMPTAGDQLEQPGSVQYELMQSYRRMIWAVHQLDRDTSGLNLFVRRKRLVPEWVERLKAGTKTYLAVCEGSMTDQTVAEPVGWIGQGVRGVTSSGKPATTHFVARQRTAQATLVEASIETGRTHQIRIHAAHIGNPIVGDDRYGRASELIDRHALHAWRIDVEGRTFEAPLPPDFEQLLKSFRLSLSGDHLE